MTQVTITDKKLYGILGISLDGSNKLKIEEELLKKLITMKKERDAGEYEKEFKRAQDIDLTNQLLPLNGKSYIPYLPEGYLMTETNIKPKGISYEMDVFLQNVNTYKIQILDDINTDIRHVLTEEFYFVKTEIEKELKLCNTAINKAVERNNMVGIGSYGVKVSTKQQTTKVSVRSIWFINFKCFSMMFNSVKRTSISAYNPKNHDDFEHHKDNVTPLPIHYVMVKKKRQAT